MKAPFKGANVLLYLEGDRVDSARITNIHSDGSVSLVSFPSSQGSSNFQSRHQVQYGPNQVGCWGWNEELESDRHITSQVVAGHRVVTFDDADRIVYASNEIPLHACAPLYLSLNAAEAGGSVAIAKDGRVEEQSWNWQPEKPLFLTTDGMMTQDLAQIRAGPGFLITVAIALSETSILFSPKVAICLIQTSIPLG